MNPFSDLVPDLSRSLKQKRFMNVLTLLTATINCHEKLWALYDVTLNTLSWTHSGFSPVIVIAPDCAGVFVLTGPTLPLLLLFFLLLGELSLDQPLDGGLPRPLPAPVISAGSGSGHAAAGQTRLSRMFTELFSRNVHQFLIYCSI